MSGEVLWLNLAQQVQRTKTGYQPLVGLWRACVRLSIQNILD